MEFNPVLDWIILPKADAQIGFDFNFQALWCCLLGQTFIDQQYTAGLRLWVIGSHDPFKQQIDQYDKISFC